MHQAPSRHCAKQVKLRNRISYKVSIPKIMGLAICLVAVCFYEKAYFRRGLWEVRGVLDERWGLTLRKLNMKRQIERGRAVYTVFNKSSHVGYKSGDM